MTPEVFRLIEEICANENLIIHPADEFVGRVVTDREDKNRSSLYWEESEGFLEFIRQFGEFKLNCGYDSACRW